ncbi:MAG: hypothetical protein JWO08_4563 [Verrucomicrobiaceae bacterium]|nr:hypothetical protein [Verrucomicrobiaceae bacterium]
MCGLYSSTKREIRALEREFELNDVHIIPRFNIAPTQTAPVIIQEESGRHALRDYRWGLLPFWAKNISEGARMINARSETLATMNAYRSAFKSRRCLVVADGFYEWIQTTKPKQPVRFILKDHETPMLMAGLWETWKDPNAEEPLHTFTICTTTANELVTPVHDRMPVILPPMHWHQWLDPNASSENLQALLTPLQADLMDCYQVTPRMNNAKFEDPAASMKYEAELPEAELPLNSQ